MKLLGRKRFSAILTAVWLCVSILSGCQHCKDDYDICVSQISPELLASFSYDYTCMYPTMTVGDARVYCVCYDEYQACTAD